MGTKQQPAGVARVGHPGGDVLEHLVTALPAGTVRPDWRHEVLGELSRLRDVLVDERASRATPDGSAVLRERSHLLTELALQRLQVAASPDVDRLVYDLRRLAAEVRAHLRRGQGA